MPPLKYHAGQLEVQHEARTRHIAEKLAHWVGPVGEFALGADLFLLDTLGEDGAVRFTVLSGAPPLVEVASPATLRLRLPAGVDLGFGDAAWCGGLAINFAEQRRARINGVLSRVGCAYELRAEETFTLCRKYIAPSLALAREPHVGPIACEPLSLDDPWLAGLLARAETSFLGSVSPEGRPDVALRGGRPGFLTLDAAAGVLQWSEFVGDGVFKSAGNVRATGAVTLLVPDLESGDAVELSGRAEFTNVLADRRRRDPLVQHREPYPVQGVMRCELRGGVRLHGVMQPRERIAQAVKITSRSTTDEQAPQ